MKPQTLVCWSSGKDSAWALHRLRQAGEYDVVGLLTTVNAAFQRVAMHAVRVELLRAQAAAVELPVWEVYLPFPCSNAAYEAAMGEAVAAAKARGVTHMAFGDLYLADVRRYREDKLAGSGITPLFPLWGLPTTPLAHTMIASGLRAYITCVDPKQLDRRFVGREFDAQFLADLPPAVDACAERGEFHSFAYAGPMFRAPLAVARGEIVERDGFVFADLLPATSGAEIASPH